MLTFVEQSRKKSKSSRFTATYILLVQSYRIRLVPKIERKAERVVSFGFPWVIHWRCFLFCVALARLVRRNERPLVGERQYALSGAYLGAVSALDALVVVDDGKVVYQLYRLRWAIPLALSAAYAALFARGHYFLATTQAGTGDVDYRVHGDSAYYMLGASRNTRSARGANAVVDFCDGAVFTDGNRVVAACVRAAPQPHAAVLASLASAGQDFCGHAVAVALILVLVFAEVAAVAAHHRHRPFRVVDGKIKDFRDIRLTMTGRDVAFREPGFALEDRKSVV